MEPKFFDANVCSKLIIELGEASSRRASIFRKRSELVDEDKRMKTNNLINALFPHPEMLSNI